MHKRSNHIQFDNSQNIKTWVNFQTKHVHSQVKHESAQKQNMSQFSNKT
jgi:hypothetical protein